MTEAYIASTAHLRPFLGSPSGYASGLLFASLADRVRENSPWESGYTALITTPMKLSFLGPRGPENMDLWVSSGLMILFFLVVIL
ncbi:Na+/H+ Antiporter NhaA [Acetobacter tropicalis NBRC 101654]|uniref:Putative Na(+)/H(+) antiporter NhaA homolog n=1 Tax=Acetobacter tropicalis NBRC 101654 TaxID=749388 RepID=F7VIC3_9PROT|nr:Na+/H+ Antiporter NhaA [Acetobacter tropicalis NBRC 101654]